MKYTYFLVFKNNVEIDRLSSRKECLDKYPTKGHIFKRYFCFPKDFKKCPFSTGYLDMMCNADGTIINTTNGTVYKTYVKKGELCIKSKYDPLSVKSVVIRTINPEKTEKDYIMSIDGNPLNVARDNLRWAYNGEKSNGSNKKQLSTSSKA